MNRIAAAHAALYALVQATFPAPAKTFRNPTGMKHFDSGEMVASLDDDATPEVLRTMSGPVYDLKLVPTLTVVRKLSEAERREDSWDDVERLKAALAADVTLGGVVEDARIDTVESAEMDRAKWMGGGLDIGIRLLFAAPSSAG